MDTIRDIVVIVFGVTGTITSLMVLIIFFKLYGKASQALDRVGLAAEDIHDAAEVVRKTPRLAKALYDFVGPILPRLGLLRLAFRGAAAIPRIARFASRARKPPTSNPK